jgi:hypothetical protein
MYPQVNPMTGLPFPQFSTQAFVPQNMNQFNQGQFSNVNNQYHTMQSLPVPQFQQNMLQSGLNAQINNSNFSMQANNVNNNYNNKRQFSNNNYNQFKNNKKFKPNHMVKENVKDFLHTSNSVVNSIKNNRIDNNNNINNEKDETDNYVDPNGLNENNTFTISTTKSFANFPISGGFLSFYLLFFVLELFQSNTLNQNMNELLYFNIDLGFLSFLCFCSFQINI